MGQEVRELRGANTILKSSTTVFAAERDRDAPIGVNGHGRGFEDAEEVGVDVRANGDGLVDRPVQLAIASA